MSEPDIRKKAEQDRNWLEQKLRQVPGFSGYLEKEERRNSDRILRENLALNLENIRSQLDPLMRDFTDRGGMEMLAVVEQLDRLRKAIEGLVSRIRYSTYGYSGLFDAVKVGEVELDRLYTFDRKLVERIEELQEAVNSLQDDTLPAEQMRKRIRDSLSRCSEFDRHLNERRELIMTERGGEAV